MAAKKETKASGKSNAVLAKSEDGTIQITFTIPYKTISEEREKVAKELAESIEVPGFRKGKAPLNKILERIPDNTLIDRTLGKILPKLVGDAIDEHKLRLAMYPKFDLVKADDNEDWQVRATTCELPEITLGDYKKAISGAGRTSALWTPDKGKEAKEPTRQEKENQAITALLESAKLNIPKVLVEEEVNSRLSQLLEKIEKLGLNLDSYLASIGKTPQSLREEYAKQAHDTISLDLLLTKVADEEGIAIDDKMIDEAIKVSSADPKLAEELNTPERRRMVEAVLRKRQALDSLVALL